MFDRLGFDCFSKTETYSPTPPSKPVGVPSRTSLTQFTDSEWFSFEKNGWVSGFSELPKLTLACDAEFQ